MSMPTQTVRLNGEHRSITTGTTVDNLVTILETEGSKIDRRAIAVEANRMIVPRSTYKEHTLQHEDEIEIVTIVGGG